MKRTLHDVQFSVFVLTRNRADVLRNCVRSVLRQTCRDFELIILDDASDGNDTADAMAREFGDSRIRPYRAESPLGVAGGRNLLMSEARGEILISIDDDAVFTTEDALEKVACAFYDQPKVGAIAFKIMNVVSGTRAPLVPISRLQLARNPDALGERALVSSFRGGGHAVRKRIIDELGGYRSDMVFGEEEMDLAYRIIGAGYEIAYEPSIEVDHFPMPSTVKSGRARSELFYHVRNRAYLAYRYLPLRYAVAYASIWAARYALVGLRQRQLNEFIRGAIATPKFLRGVKRESLDRNALAYMAAHGGRLWY
jgi:GT2 family glycosyltransferase